MLGQRNAKHADQGGIDRDRLHQFSKTKLCRFDMIGKCARGPQCQFAHGAQELRDQPDLACTKMCKMLSQTGTCTKKDCTYAHTKSELRSARIPSSRQTQSCQHEQIEQQCTLSSTCNFVPATAADLHCTDTAPPELVVATPVKLSGNTALTATACPSLPYSPPPLPQLPPSVGKFGVRDCIRSRAFGYTSYANFNDFSSGSNTSHIPHTQSPIADGPTFPAEVCVAERSPREPAYVRLAMPPALFQSHSCGDHTGGVSGCSGFDTNAGLSFLGVGREDDGAGQDAYFPDGDRTDVICGRRVGWPGDRPSFLHSNTVLRQHQPARRLAVEEGAVGFNGSTAAGITEHLRPHWGDGEALQQVSIAGGLEFGSGFW